MGLHHQLLTEVLEVNQEAPMVVMEFQVMEGNMGQGQVVPLVGLMGVMVDNHMGDLMQTMVLQVTSLLVLTQRRTSGSRVLTLIAVASST